MFKRFTNIKVARWIEDQLQTPLGQAMINGANFNGIGAASLEWGFGNPVNAALYIVPVLVGSVNKYHAARNTAQSGSTPQEPPQNRTWHKSAGLTADIYMVIGLCNAAKHTFDMISGRPEAQTMHAFFVLTWLTGAAGDFILGRLENKTALVNSGQPVHVQATQKLLTSPVFYYTLCSVFRNLALDGAAKLTQPHAAGAHTMFQPGELLNGYYLSIALLTGVLGYLAYRTSLAAKGEIDLNQINDQAVNVGNLASRAPTIMAAIQPLNGWVLASQTFFSIATGLLIRQTNQRNASTSSQPVPTT